MKNIFTLNEFNYILTEVIKRVINEDIESNDIDRKEYDVISFANKFYTLWHVVKEKYATTYIFRKNISFSKEKAMRLYPDAVYDESLRGKSRSFTVSVGSRGSMEWKSWAPVPQTMMEQGSPIEIEQFLVTKSGYKVNRYGKPYLYFCGEDINSTYGFDFIVNVYNNDKSTMPQKGDIIKLRGEVGIFSEKNQEIYLNNCQYDIDGTTEPVKEIEPNVKIEEEMIVVSNILPKFTYDGRFLDKPGMIIFQNEDGQEFTVDTVVNDFISGQPTVKFENFRDINVGDKYMVKGTTQIKNGMGRLIRVKMKLVEPYDPSEDNQNEPNVRLITVKESILQRQRRHNETTSVKIYHLKEMSDLKAFVNHIWEIKEEHNAITYSKSKEELLNHIEKIISEKGFGTQIELRIPQTNETIVYLFNIYYR